MSVLDIFSKRQKALRGESPDVYHYNIIPDPLKVQVIHIWRETLGTERDYKNAYLGTKKGYELIVEVLCREYGLFVLPGKRTFGYRHYLEELSNFLLQEQDYEKALDVIDLSFRVINRMTRTWNYLNRNNADEFADNAINASALSRIDPPLLGKNDPGTLN